MNIRFKKIAFFALICITALFCSRSVGAADNANTLFFSWAYDSEWTSWTFNNIDNVGDNSGLRIIDEATGFATQGYITTKVSANGIANWTRAVVESDSLLHTSAEATDVADDVTVTTRFSTDNSHWKTLDEFNSGALSDSQDLYIVVTFNGTTKTTPVLKSIKVEYEADSLGYSAVNFEKKIFRVDTAADGTQKTVLTSTFDPGDEVVARIAISPKTAGIGATTLVDYRPKALEIENISNSDARKVTLCGLRPSDKIYQTSFLSNSGSDGASYSSFSDIAVAKDETYYLCYKYMMDSDVQEKNVLSQSRAILSANGGAQILASSNNYILVRGSNYIASDSSTKVLDDVENRKYPIDDQLSPSFVSYQTASGGVLQTNPFYVYKRGFGGKSRGGNLLSLPVVVKSSNQEIAFDQYYMLYNPAFYLFGNIFSGDSYAGNAMDFNSRFSAISNEQYAIDNKLNSQDSLYNYYFDENSVISWGGSDDGGDDKYKNSAMKAALDSYTKTPAPEIVCQTSTNGLAGGSTNRLNLQVNNCNRQNGSPETSDIWPNGRVWYLKSTGTGQQTIHIGKAGSTTEVRGRGTIFVDFQNGRNDNLVVINNLNFIDDGKVGVVVTGGNVEFSFQARSFKGIVFNPRNQNATSGGKISFVKDGRMLKIYGSLVADAIEFNSRNKESAEYGIMIYNDAALMNQPLPGFEGLNSVVTGK